ncbi:hypothetical protein PMALA_057100, partial [Plasmodium malariae]
LCKVQKDFVKNKKTMKNSPGLQDQVTELLNHLLHYILINDIIKSINDQWMNLI